MVTQMFIKAIPQIVATGSAVFLFLVTIFIVFWASGGYDKDSAKNALKIVLPTAGLMLLLFVFVAIGSIIYHVVERAML